MKTCYNRGGGGMVGGTFVQGHSIPDSIPGQCCSWHRTHAKPGLFNPTTQKHACFESLWRTWGEGGGYLQNTREAFLKKKVSLHTLLSGRDCFVTSALSGVPNIGDVITSGCISPAFLVGPLWTKMVCNPYGLGGPHRRGQNQKWLHIPCPLGGPILGSSAT